MDYRLEAISQAGSADCVMGCGKKRTSISWNQPAAQLAVKRWRRGHNGTILLQCRERAPKATTGWQNQNLLFLRVIETMRLEMSHWLAAKLKVLVAWGTHLTPYSVFVWDFCAYGTEYWTQPSWTLNSSSLHCSPLHPRYWLSVSFSFFLSSTRNWMQGLIRARQALYDWMIPSTPFETRF